MSFKAKYRGPCARPPVVAELSSAGEVGQRQPAGPRPLPGRHDVRRQAEADLPALLHGAAQHGGVRHMRRLIRQFLCRHNYRETVYVHRWVNSICHRVILERTCLDCGKDLKP